MTFIREISINNVTDNYLSNLEQEGAFLVWKEDSIEIWIKTEETNRFTGRKYQGHRPGRSVTTMLRYVDTVTLTPSKARELRNNGYILKLVEILSSEGDRYDLYTIQHHLQFTSDNH